MKTAMRTAAVFAAGMVCAAAATPLAPYTLRDDFQANSLGQWASYPPVQDVGYDPSLAPTSEFGALSGRSLMRVVRPPTPGPVRFGFIKRLNAASAGTVTLRFDYRLKPAHAGDEIEVGLACANGQKLAQRVRAAVGGWSSASVRFDAPAGERIQAVYLIASRQDADPDTESRFLIDNVELRAARPAEFEVHRPAAVLIDPWPDLIATAAYRANEPLTVEVAAPVPLESASCELRDQDGRTRAEAPLARHDGLWTAALNAPSTASRSGIWTLEIRGVTAARGSIATRIRLLSLPPPGSHSRLYFGNGDAGELRARTRLPEVAELWGRLEELAKTARESGDLADGGRITSMLDRRFLLPTLPGYFDFATRAGNRIIYNALVGYVDGDSTKRAAAKRAMLEVARWPTWQPPWFDAHGQHTYYPAGMLASEMALGYDLLYDDLTAEERRAIRRALIERAIDPTWREYVLDNRIMANTSNWIGHTVGGSLVALSAIYGDEDNPQFIERAAGLLRKFEDHLAASYLSDGSYGEGISYQEFDLLTSTMAMTAVDRVFGIDYWSRSNVAKSLAYQMHVLAQPIVQTQDMGDSHPPSGYTMAAIARHSSDPLVSWYYRQFPHRSISDFLFFPGSRPQHAPDGPASQVFPVRGNAVFRTGWGPDDCILIFRAGPNFNHNHADQGSFLLRAFGEDLALDAGYADYYKDPYYDTYFSQAAGHNTVLVDGNPASQSIADTREFPALAAYPRITSSITSEFYDAVTSELESVYQGRLKRFTRRLIFVKPQYLLVRDEIEAAGAPASYDWLLHVNDKQALQITEASALYRGSKASLAVRVFTPADITLSATTGHLPYSMFNPRAPKTVPAEPGILDVRSKPSAATQFLIALAPARTSEAARTAADELKQRAGEHCTAIASAGETIAFRTVAMGAARCGDVTADAATWMISMEGGSVRRLAGEQVRFIEAAGRRLIENDTPLQFAARWVDNGIELSTSSPHTARIRIFTPWRAAAAAMTEIQVPAGEHTARIDRSAP
jgi:hypothetical protein